MGRRDKPTHTPTRSERIEKIPDCPQAQLLASMVIPANIHKIHSPERECRLSLRWKTGESSEAKARRPKANVTGKSFLIPPFPATRKFLPIPPTPDRSSF